MSTLDPVTVVGGGPAGAAVAIRLAQAGQRVQVLERQVEDHDPICGGFLSWRTCDRLSTLGVALDPLGGQRITRLRLFADRTQAETALPRPALALSRRTLDAALREAATRAGADVRYGVMVRAVAGGAQPSVTIEGTTTPAAAVFLATGKYDSAAPRRAMPTRLTHDPVLGLRVRLSASARLTALVADAIELHLFAGGYAGLVRQEDGGANLCLALRKSVLTDAGGDPERLLNRLAARLPALDARMDAAAGVSVPDAIAAIPYGHRAMTSAPGLFRIGDQAAVIPSLAGEGIGIALASAEAAAQAFLTQGADAAPDFQAAFARRAQRALAIADGIWRIGERPRLNRMAVRLAGRMPALPRLLARLTRIG